ncbi:MAG: alpha/beta fold hydrolase [Endozoicomonadaceae bacterium]|nr:alpha/beta fold hydrolase [Endozoicomonadaceae bacterium]
MQSQLNAITYGDTGQNLILLHGLFGSHDNLGTLGRALAKKYRVHLVDLRNHGDSFHAETMNYADMAEDILAYIDKNAQAPVCLLGHSMGGKVAMQVGLLAPEQITALIILDIAPVDYKQYRSGDPHENILQALKKLSLTKITSRTAAGTVLKEYIDSEEVRGFLLKNLRRNADNTFKQCLNIDAIIENYAAILAAPEGESYPHPVLFLTGEYSDYFVPEYQPATLALFPRAHIQMINNCGHWIHAEQPQPVYNAVSVFLSEHYG